MDGCYLLSRLCRRLGTSLIDRWWTFDVHRARSWYAAQVQDDEDQLRSWPNSTELIRPESRSAPDCCGSDSDEAPSRALNQTAHSDVSRCRPP
jgi:hypothetical protein